MAMCPGGPPGRVLTQTAGAQCSYLSAALGSHKGLLVEGVFEVCARGFGRHVASL